MPINPDTNPAYAATPVEVQHTTATVDLIPNATQFEAEQQNIENNPTENEVNFTVNTEVNTSETDALSGMDGQSGSYVMNVETKGIDEADQNLSELGETA